MSYCLIKCIAMLLEYRGFRYSLAFLECVSAQPFGFVYARRRTAGLAVRGQKYDVAGERLLTPRGFGHTVTSHADEATALSALQSVPADEPVIVGMLNMGRLTYRSDR